MEILGEAVEEMHVHGELAALESLPVPVGTAFGDAGVDPARGDGVRELVVEDGLEGGEDLRGGG